MGGFVYSYIMEEGQPHVNPYSRFYTPQYPRSSVIVGPMVLRQTTSSRLEEPRQELDHGTELRTETIVEDSPELETSQHSPRSNTFVDLGYSSNPISVSGDGFRREQASNNSYQNRWYPELEVIRKYHDLCSLVYQISPERLNNSLHGPTLDIVEEHTLNILAYRVPKKMLILMCGRTAIAKFLRTLEREAHDSDAPQGYGAPLVQELRIPRSSSSHIGFKILISWMRRACHYEMMGAMQPIRVPKNLFAAVSLARTFDLLGLHRDACRVDNIIATTHFKRPIYPDELRSMWKCLPKDNKYLYGVVNIIRDQLERLETGTGKPLTEGVLEFMEENILFKDRVHNSEINDQYKPHFGREWCRYVGPNDTAEETTTRQHSELTSSVESNYTTLIPKKTADMEKSRSLQATLSSEKRKFGTLTIVLSKHREQSGPENEE